jgi:NitT/TauT family transport system permease protein
MSLRSRIEPFLPAVIVGVVFFTVWELSVRVFDIKEFLLPKPSSIWAALVENWNGVEGGTLATVALREAGAQTAYIAVTGLIYGVIVGVVLAFIVTHFKRFGTAITPLAVALAATPIVATAPIFNAWFGSTGSASNQSVVVAVVFFAVFINTSKGLTEVDADQLELMRSFGSSEFTILRRVRVPNAMPFFLTSLRIAAPTSVIAAIVAEYFGGPLNRLGPVITQNASFARYDVAWAAIVVASGVGLALFAIVLITEYFAMPWRRKDTRSHS